MAYFMGCVLCKYLTYVNAIMIKTILIDDEPECLDVLEIELRHYCPDVLVLAKCMTGEEGLEQIKTQKPDLVFLDISMPKMSGFEMLENLESYSFGLVFVTAYDNFALKAFDFSALDYLLKPIAGDKLLRAVERYKAKHQKNINTQDLELILANLKTNLTNAQTIAVPTTQGIDFVSADDILYAEADGAYAWIHLTNNQKIIISRTLKDLEKLLNPDNFVRIHQSYIVNFKHVKRYIRGEGGTLVLNRGQSLPVSRANKTKLISMLRLP